MARNPAVLVSLLSDWDGKDLARAQREIAKMQAQTKTFSDRFAAMGKKIQGIGDSVSKAGGTLTKSVTLPIVGIGAAALVTAAEFEKSMNRVSAVSGATGADFDALKSQAAELGRTTAFTAGQAAEGMSFLAMAGFNTTDILESMPGVLQLAAAGQMDLATASDIASNVLTGYGKSADEMTGVVDVLAKTFTSANTDLTQLGEAMKYAAPTAAGAGVQFEEAAAAIGLMGNAGIQGSMAGTSLRNAIGALLDPSSKAQKALKKLGITTTDSEGNLLSFEEIVRQLGDAGTTTGDYLAIFGKRAGPAMQALVSQGADALADLTTQLEGSGGTAQSIADTQLQGLQGQLTKLKSAFEGLMIAIADSGLLDRATVLMEQLTAVVGQLTSKFQELSPGTQDMILKFAAIAAAIGPALLVAGKLISTVGGIIAVFNPLTLKIALIVAAVAALAAGFMYLWNNSETLRTTVMRVWESIKAAVSNAVEQVKKALEDNREEIDAVKSALQTAAQFIADKVIPIIVQFYGTYLSKLIEVLGWVVGKFVDWIAFQVRVVTAIVNLGKKIGEFAKTVGDKIGEAIDFIRELPQKILDVFKSAPQLLVQAGKDIVQGLLDGAGSLLPRVGQFFLDQLPGWMVTPFKKALGIASPSKVFHGFGQNIIEGLTDAIAAGGPNVRENMRKSIIDNIKATGRELKDELDRQIQIFEDYSASVSQSIMGSISFAEAAPEFDEAGNRVGATFIEALREQSNKAVEFASKVKQLIAMNLSPEALQQVLQAGVTAGTAIADELIAGGSEAIETTNKLVKSAQDAADAVGLEAAQKFYGAGVKNAHDTYLGFKANFGKGGPARKALMGVMDSLANAAARDVRIDVAVTRNINEVVTRVVQTISAPGAVGVEGAGATGAIVRRPTIALIGEAGPEALLPLDRTRGNAPISGLGGGNVTINVQAGMGTDGAEVGRQIVDALKAYERRNGAVYASA